MKPIRIFVAWGWMRELVEVLFGDISAIEATASDYQEITDNIAKTVSFQCVAIVEYDNLVVFIDGNDNHAWAARRGIRTIGKPFHYLKLQYRDDIQAPFKVTPFTYLHANARAFHAMVPQLRQRVAETPKQYPAWGRFIAVSLDRHHIAKEMRAIGLTAGGQYCLCETGYEESFLDPDTPRQKMPLDRYLDYFVSSAAAIDAMGFGEFTHRMVEAFALGVPLIRPQLHNQTYSPLEAGRHYLDCGHAGEHLESCVNLLKHNPALGREMARRGMEWYDRNASPEGMVSLYARILAEVEPNPVPDPNEFEALDHFYERIPGWFDFQDIYTEAVREAADGARFVEIGCWKGRSTACLAILIANSRKAIALDCVDTWRGSAEHTDDPDLIRLNGNILKVFVDNLADAGHRLNVVQKPSAEASRLYDDASLDFVFIDADHSYEAVLSDLKHWLPKMAPGSTIAGHDINWPGVKRAVDEILGPDGYQIRGLSWVHRVRP